MDSLSGGNRRLRPISLTGFLLGVCWWLGEIEQSSSLGWRESEPVTIGVFEYGEDTGNGNPEENRFFTSLLASEEVSAVELARTLRTIGSREGVYRTQNAPAGQRQRADSSRSGTRRSRSDTSIIRESTSRHLSNRLVKVPQTNHDHANSTVLG